MCFSPEMSLLLSLGGCAMSFMLYLKQARVLAWCISYFTAMELLQAVQYSYIADSLGDEKCQNNINKVLTHLGWLHICFQPYVMNLTIEYTMQSTKNINRFNQRFVIIKRLCLIAGTMLYARHLYALYDNTSYYKNQISPEWLQNETLCTYKGNLHLAWAVPLANVSYYVPATSLHMFMMFAPMLTMYESKIMVFGNIIAFVSGPILASYITSNLMEQASIWCFFSIFQCMLVFCNVMLKTNYSEKKVSMALIHQD